MLEWVRGFYFPPCLRFKKKNRDTALHFHLKHYLKEIQESVDRRLWDSALVIKLKNDLKWIFACK